MSFSMNTKPIIENICKNIKLSEEEKEIFIQKLRPLSLKRKQHLVFEHQISKDVAFVISGCLRSYSVDENGFEHILQFAPKDWWITDMYSFISGKKGYLNVVAVKASEVLLLNRKDQLLLFDKIPALERHFRILTENSLVNSRQRIIEAMSLTAKERYKNFCNHYPSLINDIPQKYVAAYIGVTPEFLSKMRVMK